jgi:hypothetical protein
MFSEMEGDISNVPRWDDMSPSAQGVISSQRGTFDVSLGTGRPIIPAGDIRYLPTLRATFIISYRKSIIMKYGL